jgi:hypothetical protein
LPAACQHFIKSTDELRITSFGHYTSMDCGCLLCATWL